MTTESIQIGDTVRSFDFARFRDLRGEQACYVEGVVSLIVKEPEGTTYYIQVQRDVCAGEVVTPGRETVTVPANGTKKWNGELTDGVVLLSVGL